MKNTGRSLDKPGIRGVPRSVPARTAAESCGESGRVGVVTEDTRRKNRVLDKPTIRLTLEFVDKGDGTQALRRLLKIMLRAYGWRCVELIDTPASEPDASKPEVAAHPIYPHARGK